MLAFRSLCCWSVVLHLTSWTLPAQSQQRLANGIVARVNDSVITRDQVEELNLRLTRIPALMSRYRGQPEAMERAFQQELAKTRGQALTNLIERKLIVQEFESRGGPLPERYVEDEIDRELRNNVESRVGLLRKLQAVGQTYEDYKREKREDILVREMSMYHVKSDKILISPKKIETYYQANLSEFALEERVRLRLITLNKAAGDDNSAKKTLAKEIAGKLAGGASFAELAAAHSEDSRAKDGGDSKEFLDTKTLREEFKSAVASLPDKKASDVIETPEGFFILMVEERQSAGHRPLGEVRNAIEDILSARERERLRERWIERLRKKAFITYF